VRLHRDEEIADLKEHRKKLKDLLVSVDSCYQKVQPNKSEWLGDLEEERKVILKQLAEQTIEFSYFIRDYTKTMNFGECQSF
jgi:hypothetical protein